MDRKRGRDTLTPTVAPGIQTVVVPIAQAARGTPIFAFEASGGIPVLGRTYPLDMTRTGDHRDGDLFPWKNS